jgi:hypothetical protein
LPDEKAAPVEPLACPTCARKFSLDERFCPQCEMPLVYVGRGELEPITAAHEKARKVKPQYTGGEPVKVAFAQNLAEAQMIQGILLEEGIPSYERRSRGFDVPDFLAAGPRDILVPSAAAEAAHDLLEVERDDSDATPSESASPGSATPDPRRLLVGMAAALAGGALLILIAYELVK